MWAGVLRPQGDGFEGCVGGGLREAWCLAWLWAVSLEARRWQAEGAFHAFPLQVPTAIRLGTGRLPCHQIAGLIAGSATQSYQRRQQDTEWASLSGGYRIAFGSDLIKKPQIFLIILPATAGAGPEAGSLATAHPADKERWGEDEASPLSWPNVAAIGPAHRPAGEGQQLPPPSTPTHALPALCPSLLQGTWVGCSVQGSEL